MINVKLLKLQFILLFLYIFFIFFYAFKGYREDIPVYLFVLQIVISMFLFFLLYVSCHFKFDIKVILLLTFLFSFVFSFILRQCYWEYQSSWFDAVANDGRFYNDGYSYNIIARNTTRKSYHDLVRYILQHYPQYKIDDYGFPTILYLIYGITGDEYSSLYLMLFFNSLAIVLSTFYLYKLMLLMGIKRFYTHFFSLAWGLFPFFIFISVNGLKENFFSLFIVLSFYYMYKFKSLKKIYYLVLGILFMTVCLFFRFPVFIMMLTSYAILLMFNSKNFKRLSLVIFVLTIIGFLTIASVFKFIFQYPLEQLLLGSYVRFSEKGVSPLYMWSFLTISGFFGPFPKFGDAIMGGVIYNAGLLFKVIFHFPMLMGIRYIIKTYDYKYYAIVAYIGMNILMVTLSGVALDLRYHLTFFPLILLIIAYTIQRGIKELWYYSYIVFSIALVLVYNGR